MPNHPVTRPWVLVPACIFIIILQVPLAFLIQHREVSVVWLPPLIVTGGFFLPLLFLAFRAQRSDDHACHSQFALVSSLYLWAGSVTGLLIDGFWMCVTYAILAFYLIYIFRHSLSRVFFRGQYNAQQGTSAAPSVRQEPHSRSSSV